MKPLRYLVLPLLLVLALTLTACSGGSKSAGSGDEVKVSMKDMAYKTKEVKVKAGTKVTWVNEDVVDHAVQHGEPGKGGTALFKSGDFGPGKTFSHAFDKAGTYPVYCSTPGHADAGMIMKVIVEN